MTPRDEAVRRTALDMLNGLLAAVKAEEWSRARGAVAVCTDLETGDMTIHGPLPEITDVLAFAADWEQELNGGVTAAERPHHGWKVTVYPLLPIIETEES